MDFMVNPISLKTCIDIKYEEKEKEKEEYRFC